MQINTIKILLLLTLILNGCARSSVWHTDIAVAASSKTPKQLIQALGPPAAIAYNQKLPGFKARNQEFRYFVVTRGGTVEFRQYFYDDEKFLTLLYPVPEVDKDDYFKVIDPTRCDYQPQLKKLWNDCPDLRL